VTVGPIHISKSMAQWHREALTMPPEIVDMCDNIRNHAHFEGV